MNLKLWQASGDQQNNQSPLLRGMPGGKQPARGYRNTHVLLPWRPACFLLAKSSHSHSHTAFHVPAGGGNYVVNSERLPSPLTHRMGCKRERGFAEQTP